MGRPRKLSSTECREAVLCLLRREETAEAIGRRLGVNQSTVSVGGMNFWPTAKPVPMIGGLP